jgi:hypothetical protein
MKPEIIVNLWSFLQRHKGIDLVYQLGIRLYSVTGSDDDKLDILMKLAAWDFHLASVFPVPEVLSVQFGFPSEGGSILKGLIPAETASKYKKLELFADTIDAVRQSLPENPLTSEFKHTPYESLKFLHVNTQIVVDENGNMKARTMDPTLNQGDPHLAVNLWVFPEINSSAIQAFAGRAYLVAGDKIPIEPLLANLAVADHFLVNRFAIPASFSTIQNSGIIPDRTDLTDVTSQNDALFTPVLELIKKEIPSKYVDWQKKTTRQYILPINISARRASIVRDKEEERQSLLDKEQLYNSIRQSGEEAPAKILTLMDTGFRIGNNASMLRFGLEIFPQKGSSFRAETQNAIMDTSRSKFALGVTVYVKFNPEDRTQVAIDHGPVEAPKASI